MNQNKTRSSSIPERAVMLCKRPDHLIPALASCFNYTVAISKSQLRARLHIGVYSPSSAASSPIRQPRSSLCPRLEQPRDPIVGNRIVEDRYRTEDERRASHPHRRDPKSQDRITRIPVTAEANPESEREHEDLLSAHWGRERMSFSILRRISPQTARPRSWCVCKRTTQDSSA